MGYAHTHIQYMNYQTSSYYSSLDLSNISGFEDIMTTSSDEDIPPLEDTEGLWSELNIYSYKNWQYDHMTFISFFIYK